MYLKGEYKILLLALLSAVIYSLADTCLDDLFMRQGPVDGVFLHQAGSQHLLRLLLVITFFLSVGTIVASAYCRRRHAEQLLKESNQKLSGSEQQQSASNQQLRATEQQLRAANQQLSATEQQLRAANQQLSAANQQLRASEKALRTERDMAKQYLDLAAVIFVVIDSDQNVSLINKKGCEILECSEHEILGKNWFENFLPMDAVEATKQAFDSLMADKLEPVKHHENTIITKGNRIRIIAWHNAILRNDDGKITGTLSSGVDVTEKRASEERELLLKQRVVRAERLESLGILAGGVAHDLNNILTPMLALPDVILEDLTKMSAEIDIDTSQLCDDIRCIKTSGRTAADIIRDLLTLSRRGHYQLNPLYMNKLIESFQKSAAFNELKTAHPDILVDVILDPDPLAIIGSEAHLTQVLLNLIVNAYEAMPHGGHLIVSTSKRYVDKHRIRYEVLEEGEYVLLRVKDNGAGINSADQERIFEPFYTKKKMGYSSGTGLGLSVVYGVVKDHNGYIDLKTELGKGSEFIVYLPVTRDAVDDSEELITVPHGTESILVVDDIRQQRQLAERLLSRCGYTVETASNGHEAVDLFKKIKSGEKSGHFDMVLLDMIMADGFDGLDTYREIVKIYPSQKCIILSGFSETKRVRETLELGAGMFLSKPYTAEKLLTAVRKELDA